MVAIWTFAFLAKFGAAALGIDMVDVSHTSIESLDDFKSAVFLAIQSIGTELIPIYFVVDPRFVKIFTLNYLEEKNMISLDDDISQLAR